MTITEYKCLNSCIIIIRDKMVKTIYLVHLTEQKYPRIKKEFPNANWMTVDGDKFARLSDAKKIITKKMVKRGYAKPKFIIVR